MYAPDVILVELPWMDVAVVRVHDGRPLAGVAEAQGVTELMHGHLEQVCAWTTNMGIFFLFIKEVWV